MKSKTLFDIGIINFYLRNLAIILDKVLPSLGQLLYLIAGGVAKFCFKITRFTLSVRLGFIFVCCIYLDNFSNKTHKRILWEY